MPTIKARIAQEMAALPANITTKSRPVSRAKLTEADAIPVREVEVVTEEEKRHDEQVRSKAPIPVNCFASFVDGPVTPISGVEVEADVLFGFLFAAERVILPEREPSALSCVRLSYEPFAERMIIEAASTSLWTAVAVQVKAPQDAGFTAMVPSQHARNAAMDGSLGHVPVGVADGGFWVGRHQMPRGIPTAGFPSRPLLRSWEARAVDRKSVV
jgi:hypothetical protein